MWYKTLRPKYLDPILFDYWQDYQRIAFFAEEQATYVRTENLSGTKTTKVRSRMQALFTHDRKQQRKSVWFLIGQILRKDCVQFPN